jgi:hypothetical protein
MILWPGLRIWKSELLASEVLLIGMSKHSLLKGFEILSACWHLEWISLLNGFWSVSLPSGFSRISQVVQINGTS